jgi:hypothetical protein
MTESRVAKFHNIHSCTKRLLALAVRSPDDRVRESVPHFYTMTSHARCLSDGDGIELLKAIMAVRNDAVLYTWARRLLPWRMIIDKTLAVLRTLIDSVPADDARRRIFSNAITRLTEAPINTP